MDAAVIGLMGLVLTLLGAVAGAAIQHGVSKEKIRSLESRMAAAEARQEVMRDQLAKGDTAFELLRKDFSGVTATLSEIKGDIEQLLAKG